MKIVSTLASVSEAVFQSPDLESARRAFINHVTETKIKKEDKEKMLAEVSRMTSLNQIYRYTANALLKYEGLGL